MFYFRYIIYLFTSLHDYVLVKDNTPSFSLQNNQLSYTLHGVYI